jgi:phenylalanyl-tRNA synthetase beta chain
MKVPYKWLKEYINFDLSAEELCTKLTMVGFETEEAGDLFEVEITPNRGDCLSVIGLAREVSALSGSPLKFPLVELKEEKVDRDALPNVQIKDKDLCPRYTLRLIKGVKVEPSPSWLQKKLEAAGIRSINNVVDITNYVMMELGQPLHAFDYEKIKGNSIIIRRAKDRESITTLEGIERRLSSEMLVIAEETKPIALAGVMGGLDTEVSGDTKTVLLESACFEQGSIRRTSKRLNLMSESSYRFERGVDIEGVPLASARAAQLIQEIAGGEVAGGIIDDYPRPFSSAEISLRTNRVNKILGTELRSGEISAVLERLHFQVQKGEPLKVVVPSFRRDITREIDLIEEVARLYGYDKIKSSIPRAPILNAEKEKSEVPEEFKVPEGVEEKVREILIASGFSEVINSSFMDEDFLNCLELAPEHPWKQTVRIRNPLNENQRLLRTTLVPGLLSTLLYNINRNITNLKIFELGRVFSPFPEGEELPRERPNLAGAIMGSRKEKTLGVKEEPVDLFDLKGVVENLLKELGIPEPKIEFSEGLHLGEALIKIGGKPKEKEIELEELGTMGKLHPQLAKYYELPEEIYLFGIDLKELSKYVNLSKKYEPLPKYPGISRDISLAVPQEVSSLKIENLIEKKGGDLIEKIRLFDLYQGKQVPGGHKSLAYSIFYRSSKRTLTDEEVNNLQLEIIQILRKELKAKIRGKDDY